MSAEFLLEIGTEEIPAWMLPGAQASLKELLEGELKARGLLTGAPLETYSTPRRLIARCAQLATKEPDKEEQVVGPPKAVAYDAAGKPTRAAEAFAAKQGVRVDDLKLVETPKGVYVAAVSGQKGRLTGVVLREVLPRLIPQISFPRTMYWTSPRGLHFIRPIRWVLALWAGKPVSFALDGLKSGAVTHGHRLLANRPFRVTSVADYRRRLRAGGVVIDAGERQRMIERECERQLRGGERRRADNELLVTLTNLVEHPAVVRGEFDPAFLALPADVLITVMRHHQKYLSVEDRAGKLVPAFLAVIDLDGDPRGEIRRGHETVLAARFRDAQFFWQADQRRPLADRRALLENTVFVSQLGSYAQKVARVEALARWLGGEFAADGRRADIDALVRATSLSKCDLTTEMVGEFPELQGVIGGLYARAQGEAETTARAIYEHYKPASAEDSVPGSLEGALLSLADKLDTIVGCFAAGLIPSGSRDPYGLRRAALGVVRILVERELRGSLGGAVAEAVRIMRAAGIAVEDPAGLARQVGEFLGERARYLFRDLRQCPYDEVNAVFAAGMDDPVDAAARLQALRRIRPTPDFEPVAAACKRIRNILEQAGNGAQRAGRKVDEGCLEGGPERALYDRVRQLQSRLAELRRAGKYAEALRQMAGLRPQVDTFFDKVLVMAPVPAVRENRLTLLAHLLAEFSTIADFSEIVVSSKPKE